MLLLTEDPCFRRTSFRRVESMSQKFSPIIKITEKIGGVLFFSKILSSVFDDVQGDQSMCCLKMS